MTPEVGESANNLIDEAPLGAEDSVAFTPVVEGEGGCSFLHKDSLESPLGQVMELPELAV